MKEVIRERIKNYKKAHDENAFPNCFVPCPPFYDICNAAKLDTNKCRKCYEEFDFLDCIE